MLEKDRPGEGASSRNGGITSGNLRRSFGGMIRAWGLDRAKAVEVEGMVARADLARFIEDEGIDCDWKLTGRFTGAMRPKRKLKDGVGPFLSADRHTGRFPISRSGLSFSP